MINTVKNMISRYKTILVAYLISIVLYASVVIMIPGFGIGSHFKVLILEIVILGILSLGQTLVIISGGIDLSIAWNLTCAAVLLTFFSGGKNDNLWFIIPIVLVVSSIAGLINGLGIAYFKIPPIIMTLGMNSVLMGFVLVLLRGQMGGYVPPFIAQLVMGSNGIVPGALLIFIVITVFITFLLSKTTFGRKLYFVGSNENIAEFSGIKSKNIKVLTYTISGLFTGIGGIVLAGRLGQSYLGMGDNYTFPTVIAVVLGGASIMGGSGNFLGTIAGVIIVIMLKGFLSALGLTLPIQQIINGFILMAAVILMPRSKR
ncbi:MAG: ABC transporter permease [Actinobacteria bacterium]|nr:ABC transporter permease [Actinomycetota bacterium]